MGLGVAEASSVRLGVAEAETSSSLVSSSSSSVGLGVAEALSVGLGVAKADTSSSLVS